MAAAQCYNLKVGGQILWDLTEADILELFRCGRITSSTPCRLNGTSEWQNVNEFFPLLKYGTATWEGNSALPSVPLRVGHGASSSLKGWKIGIGCFALGLLCAGAATLLSKKTPSPDRLPSLVSYAQAAPSRQMPPLSEEVNIQTYGSSRSRQRTDAEPSRVQPVNNSSSRSVQGGIQNRVAVHPQPVSKPQVKPEEITIPLEKWTTVTSAYGSFHVKIRDHGPVTISVWLNSANPRRIDKEKGFETTGTNIVQIHSLGRAKVYYVDRIGVSVGYCVLKIIPNS